MNEWHELANILAMRDAARAMPWPAMTEQTRLRRELKLSRVREIFDATWTAPQQTAIAAAITRPGDFSQWLERVAA